MKRLSLSKAKFVFLAGGTFCWKGKCWTKKSWTGPHGKIPAWNEITFKILPYLDHLRDLTRPASPILRPTGRSPQNLSGFNSPPSTYRRRNDGFSVMHCVPVDNSGTPVPTLWGGRGWPLLCFFLLLPLAFFISYLHRWLPTLVCRMFWTSSDCGSPHCHVATQFFILYMRGAHWDR